MIRPSEPIPRPRDSSISDAPSADFDGDAGTRGVSRPGRNQLSEEVRNPAAGQERIVDPGLLDIENGGHESAESMQNDKLAVVKLRSIEIGKEYMFHDDFGNWYPVVITEKDDEEGTYIGKSITNKKMEYFGIRPDQCVESPPPVQDHWSGLIFWSLVDIAIIGPLIYLFVYSRQDHWSDRQFWQDHGDWLGHVITYCLFFVLLLFRGFWSGLNCMFGRKDRCAKSVSPIVSRRVEIGGKEVYMVGTMHVSPGSVKDVQRVFDEIDPDVIMIELDSDRLAGMREDEFPKPLDQFLLKKLDGSVVRGVHTDWNAFLDKKKVAGNLTLNRDGDIAGKIVVTPLPKGNVSHSAYVLEKRKAAAVFFTEDDVVVNYSKKELEENPDAPEVLCKSNRVVLQGGPFRHCFRSCRMTAPSIPCYLVSANAFTVLDEGLPVSMEVRSRNVAEPPTCGKKCCRLTCLLGTGIGVMYGLIRMAGVEVGGEFLLADKLAREHGKAFATIDLGMGRLGQALKQRLIPYPSNLLYLIFAWISVPRHIFTWFLHPMAHKLDLPLNFVWGFARFKLRTFLAFLLGAGTATLIIWGILELVTITASGVASSTASASGATDEQSNKVAQIVGYSIGLGLQLYLYPAIYKGLLDSRDEQMYRGAVAQIRLRPNATKFMIVIGAAHTNGMMRRMYQRGLMPNDNADDAKRDWAPFPFNKGVLFNYLYYGGIMGKDKHQKSAGNRKE